MSETRDKKLKFPLAKGARSHYPSADVCAVCGRGNVGEPHSFLALQGGALLRDKKTDTASPAEDLEGFLALAWHGAHDGGKGDYRNLGLGSNLFESIRGGVFSAYLCSFACLHDLFQQWIEDFERDLKRLAKRSERREPQKRERSNRKG